MQENGCGDSERTGSREFHLAESLRRAQLHHTTVYEVADAWIVHLENLADFIVFLLLYEIKVESLALTGCELGKELADIGMKDAVVLLTDKQILSTVVASPHLIVVDGGVGAERTAPKLIGETITEGDK